MAVYKKALTQKEKERLLGIPINLCLVTLESVKKKNVKIGNSVKRLPLWEKKVEIVYKKIKKIDSEDKYFTDRLKKEVLKTEKEKDCEFLIKNIKIVKFLGQGIYET